MPNQSVFTGADGSIGVSVLPGAEGDAAQTIFDANDKMATIGRVQDVKVEVHSELRPFHEIGTRYASELRPGNITVRGTIGRAYINGTMLKLFLGEAATTEPPASFIQPMFNIQLSLTNPANKDVTSSMTLYDVKLDNWVYHMPEDDFVLESVGFQARYVTVEDNG
jgi:hypothetical protein